MSALYSREILRLAASLDPYKPGDWPIVVERRTPVCGSRIRTSMRVDDEGRVAGFTQDVRACALGQASAALLGAHIIGRTRAEIDAALDALTAFLNNADVDPAVWPGIEVFDAARAFPARHAAILLPFEAASEAARQVAHV